MSMVFWRLWMDEVGKWLLFENPFLSPNILYQNEANLFGSDMVPYLSSQTMFPGDLHLD